MRRIANLVDLEKCRKMSIWLQKSASIQPRTSLLKFDDLARSTVRYRILHLRKVHGNVPDLDVAREILLRVASAGLCSD